jgi:hypothetical protein
VSRLWNRRTARRRVRLIDSGDGGSLLRPLNPPLPPRTGSGKTREAVQRHVTGLAGTGALDSGNGDVLDSWLDSLRPQWLAHHAVDSTERAAVAQHLAGRYQAEAVAARRRAEHAAADRDHAERLVAVFERQLLEAREDMPAVLTDRRRRPRPTIDRLEGLTDGLTTGALSRLFLLLAAAGDVAAFYIVLAGALRERTEMTVLLVAAFSAASVGLMHTVGTTAKGLREGHGGLGRVALTAMTIGWVALGSIAFYVRTQTAPVTTSTSETVFGADPTASASAGVPPLISAVLLAGLFVASGLLAFTLGYSRHHPRMATYRSLRKDLVKQRGRAAAAEQAAIVAERAWENAHAEQARAAERAEHAAASVDAELAELKELVRVQIAEHLGEPAATNALTTDRSDDVPPDLDGTDVVAAPAEGDDVVSTHGRRPATNGTRINGHGQLTDQH